MLKRIHPDGTEFSQFLNNRSEEDLRKGCKILVEASMVRNGFNLNDFAVELKSLESPVEHDVSKLLRKAAELDNTYDECMQSADDTLSLLQINEIEQHHRNARVISSLCYALATKDYRENAEECIYEAMHSHTDVMSFYNEIKRVFGYTP